MIPFFGGLSPAGGRVVGRSFRVVLFPLLSLVGWCCLASSSFGVVMLFPPLLLRGGSFLPFLSVVVLALPAPSGPFLGTSSTQRRRQHDLKVEEAKQHHPQGRRRESNTIERDEEGPPLKRTELNFS